jgi:hypothetical protein
MKPTIWYKIRRWRKARVRLIGHGPTYLRYTPDIGASIPWFKSRTTGRKRRIRIAVHHGVQMVEWRGARWVVAKQVLGSSSVTGEVGNFTTRRISRRRR